MFGWLRVLASRIRALLTRRRLDQDFQQELDSHLALLTEENIRRGLTPDEARRQALIRFGGVEQTKEQHWEARGLPALDSLLQDLRFAFRMLRKNPGFTVVGVLTLALGIGANTAIFSVVNGVLLRPLPYSQPSRLVEIFSTYQVWHSDQMAISAADFLTIQRQARSLAQMALFNFGVSNLTGQGEPEQLWTIQVSPEVFRMLGVSPALGRWFLPEEEQPGKNQVVILGHAL